MVDKAQQGNTRLSGSPPKAKVACSNRVGSANVFNDIVHLQTASFWGKAAQGGTKTAKSVSESAARPGL
jgi:hypothetical protein